VGKRELMSDPLDRTPSFAPPDSPVHHARASKRPRQQGRYSSEEPEEAPCGVPPKPSTPARPTRQAAGCEPNPAVPPTRDSKTSNPTEYQPRKFGKNTCPLITQSPCGVSTIARTFSRHSPQPRTCRRNPHHRFPRYHGKTDGDDNDCPSRRSNHH
jgi:hypothetical protein